MNKFSNSSTCAVRSAMESDQQFGAVVPPLHLSSNFTFQRLGERREYDYTRSGNPTRQALADTLAEMEHGAGATVTSSGMSAIALLLCLVKPGQCVLAPHDCYGGTHRLLRALAARGAFDLKFLDLTAGGAEQFIAASMPALVIVESPSNPLLRVTDIGSIARASGSVGAMLAVDNTFLSPALQNPLCLGADFVVHSTTKYLNGHSDVVGGAVISKSSERAEEIDWWANCLGVTGAPFDSYLTLRGVRSLHARLRQHQENAERLVCLLQEHAAVERTYYPGLPEHPGHDIAREQQRGFGGMVSFDLGGGESAARLFVENLRHFSLAESLGGVESLVAHPATMTHASLTDEELAAAGISTGLVRLSVGIEDADDLVADVRRALNIALAEFSILSSAVA